MPEENKPTRTMSYKRVDYSIFLETCRDLGKTEAEVCTAIGYSESVYNKWLHDKKMPQVAAIACEALRRRNGKAEASVYLVKCLTKDQAHAIEALARGLGIEYVNV